MSDAPDLKNCPFCGGSEVSLAPGVGSFAPTVMCPCGCDLSGNSDEGVVTAWNTRADTITAPSWHRIDDPNNPPPMDGTEVLGLMGAKDARLVWYFASSSQTKRWLDVNGKEVQPTHWMHLPQPPKEGE